MKNLIPILCLGLVFSVSCKKTNTTPEEKKQTVTDIEMQRISASDWQPYRVEVSNVDVWDLLIENCQKDDTYRFYKDSTLMHYEKSIVCAGNQDSMSSLWKFIEGRKKLIATVIGITDTAEIITLTDTEMKLAVDYMDNPAIIYFKKP